MIKVNLTFRPRSDLGQFVKAYISPAVTASCQAGSELIQQAAQGYCPVDTGALRDSITVDVNEGGSTVTATVGPHMPYAEYVEYGTGRRGDPSAPYAHVESWAGMTARSYMRPAIDESRGPIKDLFRSNLTVAVTHG
jgi:HK97 gp10 family phage protein